jgi:hypothetical protein
MGHYNKRDPKFQRWVRIQLLKVLFNYALVGAALWFMATVALAARVPLLQESAVASFDLEKEIADAVNKVIECKYFSATMGDCSLYADRLKTLLEIKNDSLDQSIN